MSNSLLRPPVKIRSLPSGDQLCRYDGESVVIRFGDTEVYPRPAALDSLSEYMRGDTVVIHVSLHTGAASATVWGCDLSDGYVRINADYTT